MLLRQRRTMTSNMKMAVSRFLSVLVATLFFLIPFGALGEASFQAPAQIVEYKEVVPLSSGQVRDRDVCVNFSPVMTSGEFFDGLQRHETPSGDEFRKNSQVVTNFPGQLTIQLQ